jgi:hypothetical protein
MPFVIGFAAQARNGKDIAADYLVKKLDNFKRASLASAVKKIMSENFHVTLEFIEEWKTKDYPPPGFDGPVRECLTKIGDSWRDTKKDIWIQKLFSGNQSNLICSDIRYTNEVNAIRGTDQPEYMKDYKGIVALIWRPGHENNKQTRSEQELMPFVRQLENVPSGPINIPDVPFDLWLKNDGTVDDWYKKIDDIVLPFVKERLK